MARIIIIAFFGILFSSSAYAAQQEVDVAIYFAAIMGMIAVAMAMGAILLWRRNKYLSEHQTHSDEDTEDADTSPDSYFNELEIPVWRRDAEHKLIWVNQAFIEAVDATSLIQVIKQQRELAALAGARKLVKLARLAVASETGKKVKKLPIIIDEERRILSITETVVFRNGEKTTLGFAQDVTVQQETVEALSMAEEAHVDILDQLGDGVAIFNNRLQLKYFNSAAAGLWRLEQSWLREGPEYVHILDALRERRRLPDQADYMEWRNKLIEGLPSITETEADMWRLADGSSWHVMHRPTGNNSVMLVIEDVSDKVALEQQYKSSVDARRATLDQLGEGLAVFGTDGGLQFHNPAFSEIWGMSALVLNDKHIRDIAVHCENHSKKTDFWQKTQMSVTGFARDSFSERITKLDQKIIDASLAPLPDGSTLIRFRDITAVLQVETALRDKALALESADKLKSEFLNHVSYKFRSPLNTIIGFSQILEQEMFGDLNARQNEYVGGVLSSSEELLGLINDVIDLAAFEAGAVRLESTPVQLFDVIDDTVSAFSKKTQEKNIRIKVLCPRTFGTITADQERVQQLIHNLVNNAVLLSPAGGIVTINAERNQGSAGGITIWTQDEGPSLSDAARSSLYEPFQASRPEDHGSGQGGGIGFALVSRIMQLHEGSVDMEDITTGQKAAVRVNCLFPADANN